ncbi:terminase small subunit [Ruminococcus sp. Marseille-P6503]|uniref:terminase small subunit n=1 Tax=Ruminococcus sp. Marseille-P6503 TaxID=2364796 RepID=UPI001FA9FCBA|nr:terminase small subunit [Ruminococcus sp. Marseille-P6503]
MPKLTEKQKKFCEEYLIDLNATKAAVRAGYSKKTANTIAAQNLAKLNVQKYISELQKEQSERTRITADQVLEELAAIAFSDRTELARVVSRQGETAVELTETKDLPDTVKKVVSGVKQGRNGVEISSYDKLRALELLGKHLGMFIDRPAAPASEDELSALYKTLEREEAGK